MDKRKIVLGTYDTAVHGWTLTGCRLEPAEQKTNYIDKPNGDGSWDLSTALTDGVLRYKDRKLTATLECSEGTRAERQRLIREMVNSLDGMKEEIRLPDDEQHHVVGRIHVVPEYNDLAHAAVTVTAVCEPWKYANAETILTANGSYVETRKSLTIRNAGRRAVVPRLTVEKTSSSFTASVEILDSADDRAKVIAKLYAGDHNPKDLILPPGESVLHFRITAALLTVAFREAVLE